LTPSLAQSSPELKSQLFVFVFYFDVIGAAAWAVFDCPFGFFTAVCV
jgi:hypothetical protein